MRSTMAPEKRSRVKLTPFVRRMRATRQLSRSDEKNLSPELEEVWDPGYRTLFERIARGEVIHGHKL